MIEAEIIEDTFPAPVLKDVKYNVTQHGLETLLDQYKEVPTIDPEGEDVAAQFEFVNNGRKAFVKARNSIEKTRKELKAPSLEYGKAVDSIAKEFQALIAAKETELTTQCRIVENHEKQKQEAYEEAERQRRDAIRTKIDTIKNLPLDHFNSSSAELTQVLESLRPVKKDEYEEFTEDAELIMKTTVSQLQLARTNKVTLEQAEKIQATNQLRLDAEQRIKDEAQAKERAEFEAEKAQMQKEREEFEQMKREQQEIIDMKEAEAEMEKLAEEQVKAEIEDTKAKQAILREAKEIVEAQISMFKTPKDILNAILDGKIDHVKWEV